MKPKPGDELKPQKPKRIKKLCGMPTAKNTPCRELRGHYGGHR